ncbi:hypothetical protein ABI59_03175 [Acidobacteria bacterium Mor1]|nr:hypothetical protein ABI59_03175 [Acidobacteria bacterium Mor1]
MLISGLILGLSSSVFVGAALAGAESGAGRVLEATYPLWGWAYEGLSWRLPRLEQVPGYWVLNEIMGRHKASVAHEGGYWHFWGVGYSGTGLVGLLEEDPPHTLAPRIVECYAQPYEDCVGPDDEIRAAYYDLPCRPEGFEEHDTAIICRLDDASTVEFRATVMNGSCIHQALHDGFNRKMLSLLVTHGNWPPRNGPERLVPSEYEKYIDTVWSR